MNILPLKPFYMMRHGESVDNANSVISGGGRDPDLSPRGIEQALGASEVFSKLSPRPTRIIVSSLKRTHQTASHMAKNFEQHIDARLDERILGELDGTITEAEQKSLGTLPGEESAAGHGLRVLEAINHHLAGEDIVLFVCHGGTLRRVLEAANLQGAITVRNAEIYRFSPTQNGWDLSLCD